MSTPFTPGQNVYLVTTEGRHTGPIAHVKVVTVSNVGKQFVTLTEGTCRYRLDGEKAGGHGWRIVKPGTAGVEFTRTHACNVPSQGGTLETEGGTQ